MNLKTRIEQLEAARNTGAFGVLRMHPDGTATVTTIRNGRVTRRRELMPEEAARRAAVGIVIERSYGLAESRA
jgi:hypothetical protein